MVRRLDYFRLPVVASYGWMLAAFVGATAVFHAALVFAWPLSRVGWKVVDYVWLLFGLLGALSGVQAVRQEIAAGLLPEAEDVVRSDAAAIPPTRSTSSRRRCRATDSPTIRPRRACSRSGSPRSGPS